MKITNACEQYFNACQELGNWKNNDKWTNAGLAIEVLSYFTIAVPLIVLATYETVSLSGRIAQIVKPSRLDETTFSSFQKSNTNPYFYMRKLSLMHLSELKPSQQKEALNGFDCKNLNAFIDTLGGVDNFLEMLSKADPNILALVPLMEVEGDPILFKYASLSEDEVRDFPLNQLSPLTSNKHVQILKAQIDKFPKTDHDKLLPLDDLSSLTLRAFNSHIFTKDQIDELINSFGELAINLIPEEQIQDFIIDNEKTNNVSTKLYNAIFTCLDVDVNKLRFSFLPHGRVKEIMLEFKGAPLNLLSTQQENHFFGNLTAQDVEGQTLYNQLFPTHESKNASRFQLLSKENAANIMLKFKGAPKNLLSTEQANHFLGNLKATEVDQTLYDTLFYWSSKKINQARFQLIPKEEAAKFMLKFKGAPKNLLSAEQAIHFLVNLKAEDIDGTLYNALFYDSGITICRARFQLIPNEEAAKFMLKFKGHPLSYLVSKEQENYFFSHLKAEDMDDLYNQLFPYGEAKNAERFHLIPKEEASKFMLTFQFFPLNLLSREQEKYFFGNLKANDVDQTLYNKLLPYGEAKSAARFQLLSESERIAFRNKFPPRVFAEYEENREDIDICSFQSRIKTEIKAIQGLGATAPDTPLIKAKPYTDFKQKALQQASAKDLLGLSGDILAPSINQSFKRLSLVLHPDKTPSSTTDTPLAFNTRKKEAEELFKILFAAKEYLLSSL